MKKISITIFLIFFFSIDDLAPSKAAELTTKKDLETFLLQTELKVSYIWEGQEKTGTWKFDYDGKAYIYDSGQKTPMVWETISGDTFRMGMTQKKYFDQFGWSTIKINYNDLTAVSIQDKDPYNMGKVFNYKILSPKVFPLTAKVFAKKETKERVIKVTKKIPENQITQILDVNCQGFFLHDSAVNFFATFEIDFEEGHIYTTLAKGNKIFKSKDKILSFDDKKLTAIGSPYLTDKDIGEYKIEYTFNYKMISKLTKDSSMFGNFVVGVVEGKEYIVPYFCYPETYLVDKSNIDETLKTYANSDGYTKPYDFAKGNENFNKDVDEQQEINKAKMEKQMAEINKQISNEYKNAMGSLKMKKNKYGSSQLEQTKTIVEAVSKEDFKTYNVTSLISYYFFDSLSNYLESLEFLYRAYDKNTDADKLKAQIAYLKSSKGSEKERLGSTKQIINSASLEIQADVQNESIVLSDEAKKNYQKSLPFAFKATESGYKLFIVSKGLFTEIKGSSNLLGTLLKNANELKGAAKVIPLIPDYVKNVGSTAKLIFSGAKAKKIKDDQNLGDALDELDLST